jgi:hypothetical protein
LAEKWRKRERVLNTETQRRRDTERDFNTEKSRGAETQRGILTQRKAEIKHREKQRG